MFTVTECIVAAILNTGQGIANYISLYSAADFRQIRLYRVGFSVGTCINERKMSLIPIENWKPLPIFRLDALRQLKHLVKTSAKANPIFKLDSHS